MEEKVRISILLEIYGKLLTEKQSEFMQKEEKIRKAVEKLKSIKLSEKQKEILEEIEEQIDF